MSKLSRTKGHSFERWTAIALRVVFPQARRQLEYHENDCKGIDLAETGLYKFQCKRGRRHAPVSALKEVMADEELGEVPVLVTKGDGERVLAILPFEELVDLLRHKYYKSQL